MATLVQLRADLASVEEAIRNIVTGTIQEYTLDTGQSRQAVKKLSLKDLRSWKGELEAQIAALESGGYNYIDAGWT